MAQAKKTPPGSGVIHGLLLLSRIRFLSQRCRGGFYCFSLVRCFYFCLSFFFFFFASSGFDVCLSDVEHCNH